MAMKYPASCLVALIVFCSFCEGQWRSYYRPSPRAYPAPRGPLAPPNPNPAPQGPQPPPNPYPVPGGPQPPPYPFPGPRGLLTPPYLPTPDTQQSTQTGTPLTWQFPGPPQIQTIPVGPSSPRIPVAASSVAVTCNETSAHVEVMENLFGNGLLINPAGLTLGNCGPSAEDNVTNVLIFDVELQACGSTLSMTNDSIIYTYILNYIPPTVPNIPVVRSSSAAVLVQCHYPRIQNVSSHPVSPYWRPFSAVRAAQEFLYFSMNLMTDNWQYLRADNQYSMGEMIRIQVSVMQYYHVPLRVYVDSCIATTSPDTTSSPSYVFIDQGCMLDGLLTGSISQFLPRTADNMLQFQLEAFQFQGAPNETLYITCHLIATMSSDPVDSNYRACSYINGWREASGVDSACSSCYSGGGSPPGYGAGSSATGVGGSTSGPINTGPGAPGSGYGPGTNVPTGGGGGAPGSGYGPGPNVPTTGGGGAPGSGYGPGTNVPTAGGGGAPGSGYWPGTNVPTGGGGGAPGSGYWPGTNVPTGPYGPINTGPTVYIDIDESLGSGPTSFLGPGFPGSFGNFGKVPNFPPFF